LSLFFRIREWDEQTENQTDKNYKPVKKEVEVPLLRFFAGNSRR
jgi:hypothetical protein